MKTDTIKKKIEDDHGVFYDATYSMSIDELKVEILKYTKALQDTLQAIATKPEILEAEAKKKEVEKPYNDKIKEAKDKIKQLKRFVDEDVCKEDLEAQMIKYACEVEETKIQKDLDDDVKEAKDNLDVVKGPYTDAKGVYQLKISYLHLLIKEKIGA